MNYSDSKEILLSKASHKQDVYSNILSIFNQFVNTATEFELEVSQWIRERDDRVKIELIKKSEFEFWLQVGGDMIIFSMQSNTFSFPPEHPLSKSNIVKENPLNAYCGIIEVYNFLSDSVKYNRVSDIGEMTARIFVNKENYFIIEGSEVLNKKYREFGAFVLGPDIIQDIIQQIVIDAITYDLWVPPFQEVKYVPLQLLNYRSANQPLHHTQKRLGFVVKNNQ